MPTLSEIASGGGGSGGGSGGSGRKRLSDIASGSGGGGGSSGGKKLSDLAKRGKGNGLAKTGFDKGKFDRAADEQVGAGPGFTPVRFVLDTVSRPSYAIGNLIAGKPGEALKNLSVIPIGAEKTTVSEALEKRGFKYHGGVLGAIERGGIDILTDPVTYLTLGVGGVAKGSAAAAARAQIDDISRQFADDLAKGSVPKGELISRVARDSARVESIKGALPKSFKIGVNVPFTRIGATAELTGAGKAARAGRAVGRGAKKVPGVTPITRGVSRVAGGVDDIADLFRSTGGASPAAREAAQAARRAAAAEEVQVNRLLVAFNRDLRRAAKKAGISRREASDQIRRYLDDPARELPEQLQPLAEQGRAIFDEIGALDEQAGIVRGSITDYVTRAVKDPETMGKLDSRFAQPSAKSLDTPFYVKNRTAETLDDFEAAVRAVGGEVEDDVVKLMAIRHKAGLRARIKKGIDEAVLEQKGYYVDVPSVQARIESLRAGKVATLTPEEASRAADDLEFFISRPSQVDDTADEILSAAELRNQQFTSNLRSINDLSPDDLREARTAWQQVESSYFGKVATDPVTADDLAKAYESIGMATRSPQELRKLQRGVNGLTSRWKALALLSPGYHIRNIMDDGFRAFIGGLRNPADLVAATRVVAARYADDLSGPTTKRLAKMGAKQGITAGGRKYTADEFNDLLDSLGVTGSGFTSELGDRALGGVVSLPGDGRLATLSRRFGQFREDSFRAALFKARLDAGDDIFEAARAVRNHLFDYGDVGRAIDRARRFWLPFVTFTSKAIPYTARTFASRPGIPAAMAVGMRESNRAASGNPDNPTVPSYLGSAFAIPVPGAVKDKLGLSRNDEMVVSPNRFMAFGALDLLDPRWKSIQSGPGGMITPFVKAPTEIVTNYSLFKGRQYFPNERVVAPNYLAPLEGTPVGDLLGMGAKSRTVFNRDGSQSKTEVLGYSPRASALFSMLPAWWQAAQISGTEGGNTQFGQIRYFTGAPVSTYDRAQSAYYAEKYGK